MKYVLQSIILFLSISAYSQDIAKMPLVYSCYDYSAPRGSYTVLFGNLPNAKELDSQENKEKVAEVRKQNENLLRKNGCKVKLSDTQYYPADKRGPAGFCFKINYDDCLKLGNDEQCPVEYSAKFYNPDEKSLGKICVLNKENSRRKSAPVEQAGGTK